MIVLLAALVLAPWTQPPAFRPLPGWQSGASGNRRSLYDGLGKHVEATAWTATNVRYRDDAIADPPNKTLSRVPPNGVIVWAVLYSPAKSGQARIRLDFRKAKRFDCCEGADVAGGEYELAGAGPGDAYSAIVRIYFGSRPGRALRAEAQRALDRLVLPSPA